MGRQHSAMRRVLPLFVLSFACSQNAPAPEQAAQPDKPAPAPAAAPEAEPPAASNPSRTPDDMTRDADRKPHEVLAFFGIEKGSKVVELMAGRGWYTSVIAEVVGPEGHVWAQNNEFVLTRFAEGPLGERLARPGHEHVERIDAELDDPKLPENLDAVVIVLFYHDTYWQGVDRKKMNDAVFAALKPGGVYGVVDHHAEAGSGDRDVKTIHRVDAALVKKEIEAAGFVLEAESDLLEHPEDDRTINVFKDEIRGKTDRFVYRFRKPK